MMHEREEGGFHPMMMNARRERGLLLLLRAYATYGKEYQVTYVLCNWRCEEPESNWRDSYLSRERIVGVLCVT